MQNNINKSVSATDKDILLKMVDIEKTFPGVKALDHAQLTVKRGTVHALMGENGAGKSTLMKCLFGVYSKDNGHIYVEGQEVNYIDDVKPNRQQKADGLREPSAFLYLCH